jgi:hypothetical protein
LLIPERLQLPPAWTSTVRRRHLPKLFEIGYVLHRMIESRLGHRRVLLDPNA